MASDPQPITRDDIESKFVELQRGMDSAADSAKSATTKIGIAAIILVLILQVVAIGGAYLFAWISGLKGNKYSIIAMLIIWTAICFAAYFLTNKMQFYCLGGAVGLVMGGIQSLSRSTYSKLLPENTPDTASYFSFYDVLEKMSIILGTFIFGFFQVLTGSIKYSVLSLGVFFVLSILILMGVRIKHNA